MSRPFSDAARAAALKGAGAPVFVELITIRHEDLASPIRLTRDVVDTVSRGETYAARWFQLQAPDSRDDAMPQARLTVSVVAGPGTASDPVAALRGLQGSVLVDMEVVLASDPDTVLAAWPGYRLASIQYQAAVLSGDLSPYALTGAAYPGLRFLPSTAPGLFS